MYYYKNKSLTNKTFYGVVFEPGSIHEVPGIINNRHMIRVAAPVPSEPLKSTRRKSKSAEALKEEQETSVENDSLKEDIDGTDCNQ